MSKRGNIIRIICFIFLLLAMLIVTSPLFFVDAASSKTFLDTFYAQREDSLQVIYLGNSGVYRYYQAPLAWNAYGIASLNIATASQPAAAIRYLMEESLKTQEPELFVVDLRSFSDSSLSDANVHNLIDFVKPSWTKVKMIAACCWYEKFWYADMFEFFFPIIRFHDRWEEWTWEDFQPLISSVKGAYTYSNFLNNVQSEVTEILVTPERAQPNSNSLWALNNLLDYCDEQGLTVLFVASPFLEHERQKQVINALGDVVVERGYELINFNTPEMLEAVGLDVATDFMDNTHTNIRGSILYTHYLAGLLQQKYGLEDLRGQADYADWDAAYIEYSDLIGLEQLAFYQSLIGQPITLPLSMAAPNHSQTDSNPD